MGAWGTAILSDDTATDIRDAFTDLVAEGLTPVQATDRLIVESADILANESDSAVFWLALAATQWKLGRLIDSVSESAIQIIDSGADLLRWQDNSIAQINQRKKHLAKLREQLLSPLPKSKKVKSFPKSSTDFKQGDVFVFQLDESTAVRFCVLNIWSDRGGSYADICLLGIDDGTPFHRTSLQLADTLGPHFTMLFHEPAEKIVFLRRSVTVPEKSLESFRAWNNLPVQGHACKWQEFPAALRKILSKLSCS